MKNSYFPSVVTTPEQLAELVAAYSEHDHFTFDIETVGGRPSRKPGVNGDVPALDERTNQVLWIGMACPGRADIVPLGHPDPENTAPKQLRRSAVLERLRPLFFSDRTKINHNVKFDVLSLSKYWGDIPPGPYLDTLTLVHILNENLLNYDLGSLSSHYLGFTYDKLAKSNRSMDTFPFWDVAQYVGLDAKLALLLYQMVSAKLENKPGLRSVLALERDVTEVLIWAHQRGVGVDRRSLEELDSVLAEQVVSLATDIYRQVGRRFKISSTQQLGEVLYGPKESGNLGLPCKTMTKGGTKGEPKKSTSKAALDSLVRKHSVIPLLIKYREVTKLKSAFTSGLLPFIDDDDRIRASLKQSGTVTGRFSCSKPNLQQIPRQTNQDDDGARVRAMFVASPGSVLIVGDYSQVELRLLAHLAGPYSKRSRLVRAFTEGSGDPHLMTASGLYGVRPEDVTKEQRQDGKTANFLLSFGGGPDRLIATGGYTTDVAERMFKGFHATYPEITRYADAVVATCRRMKTPYVETILGRRRRLPQINVPRSNYDSGKLRAYAERQAVNHQVQGSAADINKMAMVRAHRRIQRHWSLDSWRVLLTVHDEIMLEVPENRADEGIELLTEAMEGVKLDLKVPLVADVHAGPNWASAK